jgi:soluble lytic murein transglycosylase-like protein
MNIIKKALGKGRFFVCLLITMTVLLMHNALPYNSCNAGNNIITKYSDNVTNAHVNWILERSSKISRQTAINIYNVAMSMENGLLYIALIYRESNFDPTAVSEKGAIGLTQIMPRIWVKVLKEQGIIKEKKDLFDYDKNLLASKYILTEYYKETGSWKKALNKYVGKHKTYARDVLAAYGELQLLKQEYK